MFSSRFITIFFFLDKPLIVDSCFLFFSLMVNLLLHIVTLGSLEKKGKDVTIIMHYVTHDTYVMTSLWGIKVLVIRHLEHML